MDITVLKSLSNLQTNFMYLAYLQPVNALKVAFDAQTFTITARETEIPAKTRTKVDFRFLGRQMSIRQGVTHEGEMRVTMVLDNNATFYTPFVNWYYQIDKSTLAGELKSNMVLQLLNVDGKTTNSVYAIIGCYPLNIPNLAGLNQEGTEGHLTFEATFGFDDIAHGTVSGTTVTWDEASVDYYPYATVLGNLKLPYTQA